MVNVIVGTVLGFLAGLGTGGGSLLILWLTVVLSVDPAIARSVNLLFYIPSALIASLFRIKKGGFSLRKVAPGILAGSISAAVFCYIGTLLNTELLKKAFGILLIAIGINELLYRPQKAR